MLPVIPNPTWSIEAVWLPCTKNWCLSVYILHIVDNPATPSLPLKIRDWNAPGVVFNGCIEQNSPSLP